MAKKPINYTSRDFSSIKDDLVNYAKRYYPDTFKDFNEASFGALMLDMVSYVGDQLSFYTDFQANESFIDSAIQYENVVRLAKQMGFKFPGAATASGVCSFYVLVPANINGRGPDINYFPILQRGSLLSAGGGAVYTLNESVDFTESSNEITVARVDESTGAPTFFAIKALGEVISGQRFSDIVTVSDYERFRRIQLSRKNITEVISIKDSQGHEYYEVEHLSQDVVYLESTNYETSREAVPYIMKVKPVPRRFITENDTNGNTFVQFGYGSEENITGDLIVDPADVVLEVSGRTYISSQTFDPTNLIKSDKFGVAPTDTTLTITYAANTVNNINSAVNSVTSVIDPIFTFKNESSLTRDIINIVETSLEVTNDTPILGDSSQLSKEEIRNMAFSTFSSQNRAVTRSDYINLCYRMPSKFGKIKRVNVIQDKDSFKRNLNIYILSENIAGNLTVANSLLKQNLKTWLSSKRMVNDTVDILDANIINYGIEFEVLTDLNVNRFQVLQDCIQFLKDNLLNVKSDIGEALYVSEIYKLLNEVEGVTDATDVRLVNKIGGDYSNYVFDIDENLSNDGRFLIVPENAVAEILIPDQDITGTIK
tara:strand:+ start:1311 stop:3104 length:1794 start_codon:yes stop_codon:yes gene_type:complete